MFVQNGYGLTTFNYAVRWSDGYDRCEQVWDEAVGPLVTDCASLHGAQVGRVGLWDGSGHFSRAARTSHNQNSCPSRSRRVNLAGSVLLSADAVSHRWNGREGRSLPPRVRPDLMAPGGPFLGAQLCHSPSRRLSSLLHVLIGFSADRH